MKKIVITNSHIPGKFLINATYRGRTYGALTMNTLAIDRYRNTDVSDKVKADGGYTRQQAANVLYKEIMSTK